MFCGCQPVAVEVTLSGEASDIGLTVPLVAGAAEWHAGSVGLLGPFDLEADLPFQSIGITFFGDKFRTELIFNKAVIDVSMRLRRHSPMSARGVTRAHERTAESVVATGEPHIEQFLAACQHLNLPARDGNLPTQGHREPPK